MQFALLSKLGMCVAPTYLKLSVDRSFQGHKSSTLASELKHSTLDFAPSEIFALQITCWQVRQSIVCSCIRDDEVSGSFAYNCP